MLRAWIKDLRQRFGNGLHPTTRDCVDALELVYSREKFDSALDLGCGTGILALAAVRLGCEKCLAVDFNMLAVKTARDYMKAEKGITEPEMILPITAHAAFHKGAHYFGVKVVPDRKSVV